MLDSRWHVVKHDVDLVAQQVRHRRGTALVGHVLHIHLGQALEQFARQVDGAAIARRAEVHFAGVGLGVGDEVLHALVGLGGVGHQQVGHIGHAGQRCEVLHGVERHLLVQAGVDGVGAHGAHEQSVAVRSSLGGRLATDVAACARAVVHHDGLAELSRQRLADDAGQDVGGAACGEGHDDGDGLGGVSLGQGGRTAEQTSAQNDGRSDGTQGEAAGGVGMLHGGLLQRSWWTKIAFGGPRPNRHSV